MNHKDNPTPIYDFIRDYAASNASRFHMPGHKGSDLPSPYSDILPFELDITEIKGADSLYEASGIIAESEQYASALFGSRHSFYSTEGSSQCIRAMLYLAVSRGNHTILAARNVHRSFLTAAALLDLSVEWLYSESEEYSLCACPVSAAMIEQKLTSMAEKPAAIYLTSPDYLGNLQDISAIAKVAHKYGILLMVDNAHGAYLHFLQTPFHPLDLGADMCCDSAHKTLPALTGCAYLHIANSAPSYLIENARQALSLFGSTSPSYLQLLSLDFVNAVLADNWTAKLYNCLQKISDTRTSLKNVGWKLLDTEPMKITIHASQAGYSGMELAELLRSHQIECEYADPDYLVLMPTPYNTETDFAALTTAFRTIPFNNKKSRVSLLCPKPNKAISIREALLGSYTTISAADSVGRICADCAIACPPAVPIVVAGELINEEIAEIFSYYHIQQLRVVDASPQRPS